MDIWKDWSLFDWLCIIFNIKKKVLEIIKIIEIFIHANDPHEAEALIHAHILNQDEQ